MSFLKQLLKPFVEFEDSKAAGSQLATSKANTTTPATPPPAHVSGPGLPAGTTGKGSQQSPGFQGAGYQPDAAVNAGPEQPAHHPLVDEGAGTAPPLTQVPAYSPGGTITGPLPQHEQYFEKLIEEANNKNPIFQGADYKEFVDSKIDIDDIADESIKYRTAFNILKGGGLTKDKLLSTGQEYINLIGRDLNAFQGAYSQQYKKEVRQKEALIEKKVQELQALTIKLNALKQEINQASAEINLTKERLNTTKNSFLLAGEKKQKEIETELEKIAHYF
jgi:hypothetical protein